MSNPTHGRPPTSAGSSSGVGRDLSSSILSSSGSLSASSPVSVTVQPAGNGSSSSSITSSASSSCASGVGMLKDKSGLPPVYLNLNDHSGKEQGQSQSSCSPLQHWDDARTADVWLSSLHSVIFIITCALAAFILFRNVLTW